MGCWGALEQLDAELGARSRDEGALRLRLGQVLEALGRGGCLELGFSSLTAYALERAERGGRWVERARWLARRLEGLPAVRAAVAAGQVSWSMGELLAQRATAEDEQQWLRRVEGRTLREVRALYEKSDRKLVSAVNEPEAEQCTLSFRLEREDAWLFEATRALLDALGTRGAEEQVEALLAEAQDTLLAALPRGALDVEKLQCTDAARERWWEQLKQWRAEAERVCEERFRGTLRPCAQALTVVAREAVAGSVSLAGLSSQELDTSVRALSAAFAAHELELAQLLLELHRANGWRRLGYASEGQYARERLGMSRSSLLARRALALRLERLPLVAAALRAGSIGVEAALQLVRVATPLTEAAWLERARQRTVKHLREEVAAAVAALRLSGEVNCPPPLPVELEAYHELERAVVSGRICQGWASESGMTDSGASNGVPSPEVAREERRIWSEALHSLSRWLEGGVQLSAGATAAGRGAGRVVITLRVSREARAWWQTLQAQSARWLPRGMSWLRFLCLSLWQSWRHALGENTAYGRIYIRDRHRCASPVCSRRDVTPHHLIFRSAGGGEEAENLVSLCSECHLFGVHGGRIRAWGPASSICWELGPREAPCLRVQGRERRAA